MNQNNLQNITPKELWKWLQEDSLDLILIDVREDNELDIAKFPANTIHLPLSRFDEWGKTVKEKLSIDSSIVSICHAGVRSRSFALWLLEQDSRFKVWNLSGGIEAWSLEIDPSVPRY